MPNVNNTRMRKYMPMGGLLMLLFSFIVLSGFYSHNYSTRSLAESFRTNQSDPQDSSTFVGPLEKINKSTLKALQKEAERKVSADEDSIKELFDSIFEMVLVWNWRLPLEIETSLKNRLVRSELKFRDGKHKKIRESDLAKAFNNLAERLGLPEHSKTFVAQIRMLRVMIMPDVPTLIGKVNRNPNHATDRKVGAMMTTEMSPAEAILIATVLMQQKLFSDLYQTTPQEWGKKVRELVKSRKDQQSNAQPLKVLDNPKSDQIHERLFTKGNTFEVGHIAEITTKFLDDLGID